MSYDFGCVDALSFSVGRPFFLKLDFYQFCVEKADGGFPVLDGEFVGFVQQGLLLFSTTCDNGACILSLPPFFLACLTPFGCPPCDILSLIWVTFYIIEVFLLFGNILNEATQGLDSLYKDIYNFFKVLLRRLVMLNVYIDAQRWLSIYEFSDDNHEQFGKLCELVDKNEINVFLPEQTYEEVLRNRENKIRDALKQFDKLNIPAIPNLCKGYTEYETLKELIKQMEILHRGFLRKIQEDNNLRQLYADKVLDELFTKIDIIPRTQDLINKAKIRFDVGNPPGKDKSYGDAINWETLLEKVPNEEDIYFISSDKDYKSVLDEEKLNQYLHDEWNRNKKSKIFFHTSLAEFIRMHLKSVELKTENAKEELIGLLVNTPDFNSTHIIISKLSQFSNWTENQVIKLLQAADRNNQVYWIINDPDIKSFYNGLLKDRKEQMLKHPELNCILDRLGYKIDFEDGHGVQT